MDSSRLAKRSWAIAKANVETGIDAALTIGARTLDWMSVGRPIEKAREAQLMVQEKVEAAIEGAIAAQAAWSAFVIKAAFGGMRTFDDMSLGLAAISEAPAQPARRMVHANARRLTEAKAL